MKAKTIRLLPKTRLLCCCLLLISLFFIHQSCTKLDTSAPSANALTDAEATQKFFNVPANAPAAAKRLAAELKRRNDSSEFVRGFVRNNGYPAWDKVLLPVEHAIAHAFFFADASSGDTVIIVPVVPRGQSVVGSFIKAFLSGDVNVSLYRGSDYAAYSFNDVPADSISADKAAMQIMILNNYVFGYASFKINDDRLFSSIAPNPGHKPRIATVAPEGSPGLLGELLCTRVCISILCTVCYQMRCPYTTTTCLTSCESIGPSNPGGDPTTGGGGGGGTPPGDFPCAGSQGKGIGIANPCGGGGGPTIPPVEPITPPLKPCEIVDSLFTYTNYPDYLNQLHDSLNLNYEKGYAMFDPFLTTVNAEPVNGEPGDLSINFTLAIPADGFIHTHYNDPEALSIFSADDLANLCTWFKTGKIKDIHTFTMTVITGNSNYIIMIDDPAKFSAFADNYGDKEEINFLLYKAYKISEENSPETNEKRFLLAMEKMNSGLKVFKGNAALTSFSPIKIDDTGLNVIPAPCN